MENDKPERITPYEFVKIVDELGDGDEMCMKVHEKGSGWRRLKEDEFDETHADKCEPAKRITESFHLTCRKCGSSDIRFGGSGYYFIHLICRDCGNHSDSIDV